MTERPSLRHKLKEQLAYWAYTFALGHGAAVLAISISYRPPFPAAPPFSAREERRLLGRHRATQRSTLRASATESVGA